jgi:hypothetical protein
MPATGKELVVRSRKAHRKSRLGCGNCKIRRVKVHANQQPRTDDVCLTRIQCDEAKPKCRQCLAYGISCNYERGAVDMQLSFDGVIFIDFNSPPQPTINPPDFDLPVAGPRGAPMYKLSRYDRELIDRFQARTIHTLGTRITSELFKSHFVRLGLEVSYGDFRFNKQYLIDLASLSHTHHYHTNYHPR